MPARENRKHKRVIAERTAILKIVDAKSAPDLEGSSVFCATEDLSARGMRVTSDRVIPNGALVDIWIAVQDPPRAYSLLGTVRWVEETDPPGPHQAGVEFEERSKKEMLEWSDYCAKHMAAQNDT